MPVLTHHPDCQCYYCLLDLSNTVPTEDDLKKARRAMAMKYHPDKVPAAQRETAHSRFIELESAHKTLSDPAKRKKYDLDVMPKFRPIQDYTWPQQFSRGNYSTGRRGAANSAPSRPNPEARYNSENPFGPARPTASWTNPNPNPYNNSRPTPRPAPRTAPQPPPPQATHPKAPFPTRYPKSKTSYHSYHHRYQPSDDDDDDENDKPSFDYEDENEEAMEEETSAKYTTADWEEMDRKCKETRSRREAESERIRMREANRRSREEEEEDRMKGALNGYKW